MLAIKHLNYFVAFVMACHYLCSRADAQESKSARTKSTLRFQYCYSCGYYKDFKSYGNHIHQRFPEITIEGEEYTPPRYRSIFVKFLSAMKMLLVVCVLSRVNIFSDLRLKQCWKWCQEKRLSSSLIIFLLFSILENYFLSSGAFEIFLNGSPIWSTLGKGRLPELEELIGVLNE